MPFRKDAVLPRIVGPRARRGHTNCGEAPCTGIEPVWPVRQTGWHASSITGQRERLAGVEPAYPPWQGGASAARPQAHRKRNSKGGRSRTLWAWFGGRLLTQEHALVDRCPGRIRTCNPTLQRRPLDRLSYRATVRMAGFEPAFSSTPSWRISRLSYILSSLFTCSFVRCSFVHLFISFLLGSPKPMNE
jgi:hypothetical protein